MNLRASGMLRRAAVAIVAALPILAIGQAFPSRPLHVVVPFAPGGAVDTVARIVGAQLSMQVGQAVVVENKPGGQANIGAEVVAHAAPDGYTMLLGANGLATNPTLMHMSFDPLEAFATVARVGYAPLVLVVPEASPAQSVAGLVAYIKAHPGATNYGSAAVGGSGHLASELFKMKTATDSQHVPYKGGAPALTDLIAGRLTYMLINPLEAAPHVKAGKLRALAVSAPKRIGSLPDVPTFDEAGVPGFQATVWWGFVRSGRHAEGRGRAAAAGNPQGTRRAPGEGEARAAGRGRRSAGCRRLRRVPARRDRDLGRGHSSGAHPGRVTRRARERYFLPPTTSITAPSTIAPMPSHCGTFTSCFSFTESSTGPIFAWCVSLVKLKPP